MANRFDFHIPISLLVFIHENPNNSQFHQGRTLDISLRGMQVQIDGMDEPRYEELSAQLRLVRVSLKNTITGEQIQLTGSFVWYAYHQTKGLAEPPYCQMGISFDDKENAGLPAYSEFVSTISPGKRQRYPS